MTRFGGKIVLLGFYVPSDVTVPLGDVVFKEQSIFGVRADPNIYSQVLGYMATGQLRTESLISHTFPLNDFATALDTFVHRRGGAMKVVIEP
jgi:threonine dehydrogenase-like Zn-dependent dehydrogenase